MLYSLQQLQADVMARLGEICPPLFSLPAAVVPGPAEVVARKIESLLPEAGERILREAPHELLGGGVLMEAEVTMHRMPCGLYAGEVVISDDFQRLVSVKMSDWSRSALTLILPGTSDWARQWSPEPGIAGCPCCPRAYLDRQGEGLLLRVVGSDDSGATLEWLRGWCLPTPPAFHFPSQLYQSLINEIVASL
ncbi:MAG: hypothetical protein K2G77_05335 [Muribaculaceae bacterium]|nr:hypothetical protein [Muribaculaceae bacterium]